MHSSSLYNIAKSYAYTTKLTMHNLSLLSNHLEIYDDLNKPLKFHYFWLRDHCRCSECYNHHTEQINLDVLKIPFDIKVINCQLDDDQLFITWSDGHETKYSVSWLKNLVDTRRKKLRQITLWNNSNVTSLNYASISCKDYLKDENCVKELLQSILNYGFGFVTGVEPTLKATEEVVTRMAPVRKTIFGEMWELSDDFQHSDTSYSQVALGAHNDNTYFTEATGLQIFHMLKQNGSGGESLLVDGFNAANTLKKNHNKSFDILCNSPLEAQYIEKNYYYTSAEPVIKLHQITGELLQIRYNIYDRAPLNTLEFEEIMPFYDAYRLLGNEINKESNQWWFKLNPGTVLFFDNWRLLHGRASYTGQRQLTGCYVARRDWLSAAKRLGLPLQ